MSDDRVAEAIAGSQAFLPQQDQALNDFSNKSEAVKLAEDIVERNGPNKTQSVGELDLLKQALPDQKDKDDIQDIIDKLS